MEHEELTKKIDAYLEAHWDAMVEDIASLVRIPSFEELDKASEGAPFGPGPRKALSAALDMAADMGFQTHDVDGYIGYADFPGESDTQLGIIGHMDVVPAGPGWTFEPYNVARKDGYLIGRGVIDDKGPMVSALFALYYFLDQGISLKTPVLLLAGTDEENGSSDLEFYRKNHTLPSMVITPDASYPLINGEKGMLRFILQRKGRFGTPSAGG